jgi:hypothetical protein
MVLKHLLIKALALFLVFEEVSACFGGPLDSKDRSLTEVPIRVYFNRLLIACTQVNAQDIGFMESGLTQTSLPTG